MTPSELEDAARNRYNAIGDPHFSSDMIMDIIYQASMTLAIEANVIEKKFSTTSTASTREYELPSQAISVRRLEYNGVKIWPTNLENDPKTSVTEPTGTPGQYAVWGTEYILFPTPDTTGDTITVYTYNEPQAVTTSSTLEVPSEYHTDMIDLILSVMYAKDQNTGMATYHRNLWERSINRIKRSTAKKKRGDQFAVVRDESNHSAFPFSGRGRF